MTAAASFSVGNYLEKDLPYFSALAQNFTPLDNYFASILGSTFPNRMFQRAAQTDRISNMVDISTRRRFGGVSVHPRKQPDDATN